MTPKRRVCFLFNHDQTHQIAHSLPIAAILLASGSVDVTIATTSARTAAAVRSIGGTSIDRAHFVELESTCPVTHWLDRFVPARKLAIYGEHVDFFRDFDALIVSEKSSLVLKTLYGLASLKIVHTRHGAGDRAIGFSGESRRFDLILVSGPKIRDRLVGEAGVNADRIRVVGYPKFDLYGSREVRLPVQANGRRTILYNPHPSPRLSSWNAWGESILASFADSDRFNLVFAPHVMLFEREWTVTVDPPSIARIRRPPARFASCPNLVIDLGSPLSSDMTYTQAADLYLGDVSSQVYEFLLRPRPCVFLNPRRRNWEGDPNYEHWHAGPVVERVDSILDDIERAFETHAYFAATQRALFDRTFSRDDVPASERAASAVLELLERSP